MKKIMKYRIFYFIIGGLIFSSITTFAYTIASNDVSFKPNNSKWTASNVENALNDLYDSKNNTFYTNFMTAPSRGVTNEINLSLSKGSYDCFYMFTFSWTTSTQSSEVLDTTDFTLTGCDTSERLSQKINNEIALSAYTGQNKIATAYINMKFKCKVNSDKTITVGFPSTNSSTTSISQLVVCK